MNAKRLISMLSSGLLFGLVGYAVGGVGNHPGTASPTSEATAQLLCAGGTAPPVETGVQISAGAAQVAVANKGLAGHGAKARYALELVSDAGAAQMAAQVVGPIDLDRGDYKANLPLPSNLADGYYVLRLSTVGKTDQDENSSTVETYVKSAAGVLTVVDANEYFAKSHANQGVQL